MPHPTLYIAITNHGFGHATRIAAVAATIQRLCPELRLILTTTAPRWLLASYLSAEFIHRPLGFDVGVIQSDSITMDKSATLEKLQHIRAEQAAIVAEEAEFIRQNEVGLILADIPPVMTKIAQAAEIPCWMMSNFGWDFIYRDWGGEFIAIADWIATCFGQCDRLFRLPFHEPMSAFPQMTDVGLTGGEPRYSRAHFQAEFGLNTPSERTILLTFGGLGLAKIPYQNLERFPDWQFITFDRQAPDLSNLIKVNDSRYRPVDFMPFCDRVVSKPGFSTFSEACRLDTPIVTITRAGFAEAPVLLAAMQDCAYHQILSPIDFFEGTWDFLHQPPQSPRTTQRVAKDGNEVVAQSVIDYFAANSIGG
ncbi:MAG: glycosyl transferase [Cyanothece sp. SIO1E1]|nr:glycosyl transferase [Cyanothece sp. SIO1E1]